MALLFNRSIEEGKFPRIWKTAHVTPIYKSKGDKSLCNNYRPISLLSCIGKVFERCVHGHVFHFLRTYDILRGIRNATFLDSSILLKKYPHLTFYGRNYFTR